MGSRKRLFFVCLVALIVVCAALWTAPDTQRPPDLRANRALLLAWFDAEAARDYAAIGRFFALDLVLHSSTIGALMPNTQIASRSAYLTFWRDLAAAYPDYYVDPVLLVADGDYVSFVASFIGGDFHNSGVRLNVPLVGLARFRQSKIAELWVEWDSVAWQTQRRAPPVALTAVPVRDVYDLVGEYRIWGEDWGMFMRYDADGTVYVGGRGCAADTCYDVGHFTLDGSRLTEGYTARSTRCRNVMYDVFALMHGETRVGLRFVPVSDECYYGRGVALSHDVYRVGC